MRRRVMGIVRRVGWGFLDQGLSSVTNFALGVMVARAVSTHDFGGFSIAFYIYVSSLGLSRALVSNPLVVRFSTASEAAWRRAAGSAGGAAVALGIVIGLVCAGVGLLFTGSLRAALLPLALMMPGLLLQDSWRFAFFARATGRDAFLNDLVWAVVLFPGLAVLTAMGVRSVAWIVLVWGASATVAALFGIMQARAVPHPREAWGWWTAHRDLSARYAGEFVLTSGANNGVMYGVGAISGLAAVGGLRGTALLFGPMNIVFAGLMLTMVPDSARVLLRSARALYLMSVKRALAVGALAAGWGITLLLLPSSVGRALLDQTWEPARNLVIPITVMTVGRALTGGAIVGLRAMAEAKRSLRARSISATALLTGGLLGAALGGETGAAWGFAASTVPEIVSWWWQFVVAVRRHGEGGGEHRADRGDAPIDMEGSMSER